MISLLTELLFMLCFFVVGVVKVYWHSSAHILGEAMEKVYGGCLCYGPPIESGFYYDMFLDNNEYVFLPPLLFFWVFLRACLSVVGTSQTKACNKLKAV